MGNTQTLNTYAVFENTNTYIEYKTAMEECQKWEEMKKNDISKKSILQDFDCAVFKIVEVAEEHPGPDTADVGWSTKFYHKNNDLPLKSIYYREFEFGRYFYK